MVKANVANFCIVGIMAILFILLAKSVATLYDLPGKEAVLAV